MRSMFRVSGVRTRSMHCANAQTREMRGAVVELREVFNNTPDLWEQAGNLARQAENALLSAATGLNELAKEAIYGQLTSQKRELAGPHPTALERLLVERIVLCWVDLHYADALGRAPLHRRRDRVCRLMPQHLQLLPRRVLLPDCDHVPTF